MDGLDKLRQELRDMENKIDLVFYENSKKKINEIYSRTKSLRDEHVILRDKYDTIIEHNLLLGHLELLGPGFPKMEDEYLHHRSGLVLKRIDSSFSESSKAA